LELEDEERRLEHFAKSHLNYSSRTRSTIDRTEYIDSRDYVDLTGIKLDSLPVQPTCGTTDPDFLNRMTW